MEHPDPDLPSLAERLEALRAEPLFAPLGAPLEALAEASEVLRFAQGDELTDARAADSVLLLAQGAAERQEPGQDGGTRCESLHRGAVVSRCGGLFAPLRATRVLAREAGWALRWRRDALERILSRHEALFDAFGELARRARQQELLRKALAAALGTEDAEALRDCEAHAQWVTLRRGEELFREGDPADAWCIVANGKLRVFAAGERGAPERVLGDILAGEPFGEAAFLEDARRTGSPRALRDSEVLCLRAAEVEALLRRRPELAFGVARSVARRSLRGGERAPRRQRRTLTLVPLRPELDLRAFLRPLLEELTRLGPTEYFDSARLTASDTVGGLGQLPEEHPAWLRFSQWLERRTAGCQHVLLEADSFPSAWTARALREADEVLLVGDASHAPELSALEKRLLGDAAQPLDAARTLVLLHPADASAPRGTRAWLDARNVKRHLHCRPAVRADVARVARLLAGRGIGLAVGAGGARAMAGAGVLRAFQEAELPVDQLAGTSFGGLVAAGYATGARAEELVAMCKRVLRQRPFSDLTLPITSLLRGRRAERGLVDLFGDLELEDLWLPFCCNSCDLSTFSEVLHTRGSLVDALMATSAMPGLMPPRVSNGRILVDGGATDMVPGALLRARNEGPVVALDVSAERKVHCTLARYPTSWSALWRRLRKSEPVLPTLPELLSRVVALGSAPRRELALRSADLVLRPPLEGFGVLAFDQVDAIVGTGYEHAREQLPAFAEALARAT